MEHHHHQFTYHACQSVFVSIIGSKPHRRVVASFSRREALDDLIAYLNMMMDEEVLPPDASEGQVEAAFGQNLYQPVEIIECE